MNMATFNDIKGKKMYLVAGQDAHSQLYFISSKFEIARSLSYSDQNDNGKLQFIAFEINLNFLIAHARKYRTDFTE